MSGETVAGVPGKPGWWWAKWRIAEDQTRAGSIGGVEVKPGGDKRIVQLVMRTAEPFQMVALVPGVMTPQPLENFYWCEPVPR